MELTVEINEEKLKQDVCRAVEAFFWKPVHESYKGSVCYEFIKPLVHDMILSQESKINELIREQIEKSRYYLMKDLVDEEMRRALRKSAKAQIKTQGELLK